MRFSITQNRLIYTTRFSKYNFDVYYKMNYTFCNNNNNRNATLTRYYVIIYLWYR
jgi:hypothetical protein